MKELVCIVCPNGCRIQAELCGNSINLTGNHCKRGEAFALAELTHPTRTLTTTVKTAFKDVPVLSVRTAGEIPRELIKPAMQELNKLVITEKLGCGDVVVEDLLSSGCPVIVTSY